MTDKTLLDYWYALYRRRAVILTVTLSAMITAWFLTKSLSPIYEARVTFFVPTTADVTTFYGPPGGSIVKSPLSPNPVEEPNAPYIGLLKSRAVAELVQKEYPHKTLDDLMRRDMDWLLTDQFMIMVFARDQDPAKAAGVANASVKYFNQVMNNYTNPAQSRTLAALELELAQNRTKLREAERQLEIFQKNHRTANLDEEIKQLISQKSTFESQLETARVQREEVDKKAQGMQIELRKERAFLKDSELVVTSPYLESLRMKLVDIGAQISGMQVELTAKHPQVLSLKKQQAQIEEQVGREVEKVINSQIQSRDTFYEDMRRQLVGLYLERERITATLQSLGQVLQRIGNRIREIPGLKNQQSLLDTEVQRYKGRSETLSLNVHEIRAQAKRPLQAAVIVDPASTPGTPAFPKMWLNLTVAILAGLVTGIFYAFLLDYIESTREKRMYRLLKAIDASQ